LPPSMASIIFSELHADKKAEHSPNNSILQATIFKVDILIISPFDDRA